MLKPVKPYSINFREAELPKIPDHSSSSPGPSSTGPDRAGYTRATLKKHVDIDWGNGPARSDGLVPFFAKSVKVNFALEPIFVAVSSDYPVGSCPYKVVFAHEMSHAQAFLDIFRAHWDVLVNRLNSIPFPTEDAPRPLKPGDIEALQNSLAQQVELTVKAVAKTLVTAMEADRQKKDSPTSYSQVYQQCSPAQWNMGSLPGGR